MENLQGADGEAEGKNYVGNAHRENLMAISTGEK
jgi:hypothetical protein